MGTKKYYHKSCDDCGNWYWSGNSSTIILCPRCQEEKKRIEAARQPQKRGVQTEPTTLVYSTIAVAFGVLVKYKDTGLTLQELAAKTAKRSRIPINPNSLLPDFEARGYLTYTENNKLYPFRDRKGTLYA